MAQRVLPPQSGRTVARSGDADVSTVPPIIPYGEFSSVRLEGSMSGSAFPIPPSLEPAPGIRRWSHGLPLPFVHRLVGFGSPVLCRADDSVVHGRGVGVSTPPQGLSLRSGLFCPGPSTLIGPIRPTRGHIAISPRLRLIRNAFAVRERLGDPRVVPSFYCLFLPDMPPSVSPGRSKPASSSSPISTLAFARVRPARLFQLSCHPFQAGHVFRDLLVGQVV